MSLNEENRKLLEQWAGNVLHKTVCLSNLHTWDVFLELLEKAFSHKTKCSFPNGNTKAGVVNRLNEFYDTDFYELLGMNPGLEYVSDIIMYSIALLILTVGLRVNPKLFMDAAFNLNPHQHADVVHLVKPLIENNAINARSFNILTNSANSAQFDSPTPLDRASSLRMAPLNFSCPPSSRPPQTPYQTNFDENSQPCLSQYATPLQRGLPGPILKMKQQETVYSDSLINSPLNSLQNLLDSPQIVQKNQLVSKMEEVRQLKLKISAQRDDCEDYEKENIRLEQLHAEDSKRIAELVQRLRDKETELVELRDDANEVRLLRCDKDNLEHQLSKLRESLDSATEHVSILKLIESENEKINKENLDLQNQVKVLTVQVDQSTSYKTLRSQYKQLKSTLETTEQTLLQFVTERERATAEAAALRSAAAVTHWSCSTSVRRNSCTCTCHHHHHPTADDENESQRAPGIAVTSEQNVSLMDVSLCRDMHSDSTALGASFPGGECLGDVMGLDARVQELESQLRDSIPETQFAAVEAQVGALRYQVEEQTKKARVRALFQRLLDGHRRLALQRVVSERLALKDRVEELGAQVAEQMALLEDRTSLLLRLAGVEADLKRARAKTLFQRLLCLHRQMLLNNNLKIKQDQHMELQSDLADFKSKLEWTKTDLKKERARTLFQRLLHAHRISMLEKSIHDKNLERRATEDSKVEIKKNMAILNAQLVVTTNSLEVAHKQTRLSRARLLFHRLLSGHRRSVLANQLAADSRRSRVRALFVRLLASHRSVMAARRCAELEGSLATAISAATTTRREHARMLFQRLLYGHRRLILHRLLNTKDIVINGLEDDIEAVNKVVLSKEHELAIMSARIERLEADLSCIRDEQLSASARWSDQRRQLSEEIKRTREQLQIREAHLNGQLQMEQEQQSVKIAELHAELVTARKSIAGLSAERTESIERLAKLKTEKATLMGQLKEVQTALPQALDECAFFSRRTEDLERLLADREAELVQLTSDLAHLSTSENELREQVALVPAIEAQLTDVRDQLASIVERYSLLEEQAVKAEEKADFVTDALALTEKKMTILQEQFDATCKLSEEVNERNQHLAAKLSELTTTNCQLADQVSTLSETLSAVQAAASLKDGQIDELTAVKHKHDEQAIKLRELTNINLQLSEALSTAQETIKLLDERIEKLSGVLKWNEHLTREVSELTSANCELTKQLSAEQLAKTEAEEVASQVREQLMQQAAESGLDGMQRKLARLRAALREGEEREAELQQDVFHNQLNRGTAENENARLTSCLQALQTRADESMRERLEFEERMTRAVLRCRQLEGALLERDALVTNLSNRAANLDLHRQAADEAAQASHLRYVKSIYAQQEATELHLQSRKIRSTYSLEQMNYLSTTLPNPLSTSADSFCYAVEAVKHNTSVPDSLIPSIKVSETNSNRMTSASTTTVPVEVVLDEQPMEPESELNHDISAPHLEQSPYLPEAKNESPVFQSGPSCPSPIPSNNFDESVRSAVQAMTSITSVDTEMVEECTMQSSQMVHKSASPMSLTDVIADSEKHEQGFNSISSSKMQQMSRADDSIHVTPISADDSSCLDSSSFTDEIVTELHSQSDVIESTPPPHQDIIEFMPSAKTKSPLDPSHDGANVQQTVVSPIAEKSLVDVNLLPSTEYPPYASCTAPLSPKQPLGRVTVPAPQGYQLRRLLRFLMAPAGSEDDDDDEDSYQGVETKAVSQSCNRFSEKAFGFPVVDGNQSAGAKRSATDACSQITEGNRPSSSSREECALIRSPVIRFVDQTLMDSSTNSSDLIGAVSPNISERTRCLTLPPRTPSYKPSVNVKIEQASTYQLTIAKSKGSQRKKLGGSTASLNVVSTSTTDRQGRVRFVETRSAKLARFLSVQDLGRATFHTAATPSVDGDNLSMESANTSTAPSGKKRSRRIRGTPSFARFRSHFQSGSSKKMQPENVENGHGSRKPTVAAAGDAPEPPQLQLSMSRVPKPVTSRDSSRSSRNKFHLPVIFKHKGSKS